MMSKVNNREHIRSKCLYQSSLQVGITQQFAIHQRFVIGGLQQVFPEHTCEGILQFG